MVMLVGGALLNTAYLLAGNDYSLFMDASWFPWVTETWRAVVPPNHVLLIGLLILSEAAVGVRIPRGGRMTQLGLGCAIPFHLALCVVGRATRSRCWPGWCCSCERSDAQLANRLGRSIRCRFGHSCAYALAPAPTDLWAPHHGGIRSRRRGPR
jgi:hypothetical protein